jgi:hypothetical protein
MAIRPRITFNALSIRVASPDATGMRVAIFGQSPIKPVSMRNVQKCCPRLELEWVAMCSLGCLNNKDKAACGHNHLRRSNGSK